ncbi:MAG TPA: hypothetical protein VHI52_03265 [Verrucomicrobiae bacterium]|nr:hypothetical protein [Verrucomicrobiae bacterium]
MSLSNSRTGWMVAMVVVTVLAVSELQLLAAGENDKPAKAETPAAGVAEKEAEKGRTWQGQVVERGTFKPIPGVEVAITLSADEVKAKNGSSGNCARD